MATDDELIAAVDVDRDACVRGFEVARRGAPTRWALPIMAAVVAGWAALVHDWTLAVVFGAVAVGYDVHEARQVRASVLRTMAGGCQVRMTATGIVVARPLIRSEVRWAAVDSVIRSSSLLIVRAGGRVFAVVPLDRLTAEQTAAIVQAHELGHRTTDGG